MPGGEPRSGARAQRRGRPDRRGERLGRAVGRDDAVDPVVDELDGGVVGRGDDDARGAEPRRLHDHEPIALAHRRQQQAGRGGHRLGHLVGVHEPGDSTRSPSPSRATSAPDRVTLGAVAEDPRPDAAGASRPQRGSSRRASRGCGDRRTRRSAGPRRGASRGCPPRRRPEPAQAHDLAAQALVAQPALVQRAEDEGTRRQQDAQPLHGVADAAAQRAEVLLPVALRPDLEPVDRERHPRADERRAGREQREEGERAQVHRVICAPVAQEVAQHAGAEAQRRPDRAAARLVVERVGARRRRRPGRPGSAAPRPAPTAPGSGR